MTASRWRLAAALLSLTSGSPAWGQTELTAPSLLTLRAPGLTGGTSLEMAPHVPGAIGSLRAAVGQSSPLGNGTGLTTLGMARTGFWPIAAIVDCRDPGDLDCDGITNAVDLCPYFNSGDQIDSDGNGIGNVCECSDQTGDGFVTAADLVAINAAIFTPGLVSPLCDGNHDRACDVADVVQARLRIFGNPSFCRRHPRRP